MNVNIEDLRKKVEETRKQLKEEEAALRFLERWSKGESGKGSQEGNAPIIDKSGKINLSELDLPAKAAKKETLADNILDVVKRFDDQEFTVSHVDAALKRLGKGSKAKHFKNRVSVAIRKFTDDGVLVRTHEGVGNEPHRYKLKSNAGSKIASLHGN